MMWISKCSCLVIFRIILVTSTFTLWETYTTSMNLTNLKLIIFPIPLHSTIYSALTVNCLRGLVVSVLDSYFGGRGFKPQPNLLLCLFYFIFYWWTNLPKIKTMYYMKKFSWNYGRWIHCCKDFGGVVFEIWQFYHITLWSTHFHYAWKCSFRDFSVIISDRAHISLVDSPWQGNDLMKTSGT